MVGKETRSQVFGILEFMRRNCDLRGDKDDSGVSGELEILESYILIGEEAKNLAEADGQSTLR